MTDRTKFRLLLGVALTLAVSFLTWQGLAAFRLCQPLPWFALALFLVVMFVLSVSAVLVQLRMGRAQAERERVLHN